MENNQLHDIDNEIAKFQIQKSLLIDEALRSNNAGEILKAQNYLQSIEKNKNEKKLKQKSWLFQPDEYGYTGNGYKENYKAVTYEQAKRISNIFAVQLILGTRKDQVKNFLQFTTDEQKEGFTIYKERGLFDVEVGELSKDEQKEVIRIVNFLENCGNNGKWDSNDSFQEFVCKILTDSLIYDQLGFECIRSSNGDLQKFVAVDASTLRYLDATDPRHYEKFKGLEWKGYLPKYCQVYQNRVLVNPITNQQVMFYPWELGWGVRNKTSNVDKNGYGTSEIEIGIQLITWILYAFQYNGNFFCISKDSKIVTDLGIKNIDELTNKDFNVFDGVDWFKAKAFKTKYDNIYTTELINGLKLKTSKEHRFLTIREGLINSVWKEQKDLDNEDFCLVEINSHYFFHESLYNIGKTYVREFLTPTKDIVCQKPNTFTPTLEIIKDIEFWEMIGFAIGDGYFSEHNIRIFPHHTKDKYLFNKFKNVCERYGINFKIKDINKSHKRSDGEYGYPSLYINHTTFIDWLISIGFGYTRDKKIPICVFNLPNEQKGALLRGWFSADGHTQKNKYGYKTPSICCANDELRQDLIQLLLSIGVSVSKRWSYSGKYKDKSIQVIVQNIDVFIEKVGYIQEYKNEGLYRSKSTKNKWDLIPTSLALDILNKYTHSSLSKYKHYLRNGGKISRGKVIELLCGVSKPIPDILNYHFIKVFDVQKESCEKEQMYDIEVFNNKHIFLSNFVSVHNCQGSQPKGFINIKEGGMDNTTLNEFKNSWRDMMVGVSGSHKIPVFEGIDLEWIDLQKGNREMEFNKWTEFLLVIFCSLYRIDPSELGFNFQAAATIFGQDGQKERLKHSKSKGLKPLLIFLQEVINKYIITELNPEYRFKFTGIDIENESDQVEIDDKKLKAGLVSFESMFEKYMGRKYDSKTDTILNQVFQQAQQAKQFGGQGMNDMVDEENGGEDVGTQNPFQEFGKSSEMDAITKASIDKINELFSKNIKV